MPLEFKLHNCLYLGGSIRSAAYLKIHEFDLIYLPEIYLYSSFPSYNNSNLDITGYKTWPFRNIHPTMNLEEFC